MRWPRRVVVALIVGGSLAGCSGFGGGASKTATSSAAGRPSALAQAQRTHEYPGPLRRQTARGATSPVLAIDAFATAYINWTAQSVSRTMRALTRLTVGQARSEVSLAAAQTAQDYELKRGGIANSGLVEAIAPVLGHRDEYAVVTRERTTATNSTAYQGLRPAWHLALATVTRLRAGQWVLSSWQPQN
ncbi:MAG TPA: hypothetical protein VGL51_14565 [Solirubrobacteraceae bacterium]|jgi:hypothetical protein